MPAPTQQRLDLLNRLSKHADIYINCTKPANGADVVLTAGVPAGGTWVGLTSDQASWSYKPTVEGMKVEQANAEILPKIKDEEGTLRFACAEAVYQNILVGMVGGTGEETVGTGTTPTKQTISFGGKTDVPTQTVVLVASLGSYVFSATTVELYEWFILYDACSVEGSELPYKRNETRKFEVTLKGYADVLRDEGDQIGKWGAFSDPN